MTKQGEIRRCGWCGRPFTANTNGRPRAYCRAGCRQRDYEARRRSREAGLSDAELIIARSQLDELQDALYVLEAAVEDVERDLAGDPEPSSYAEAAAWLLAAARPLVRGRLGVSQGSAAPGST